MKRYLLAILTAGLVSTGVNAQQTPQYSQFTRNALMYNPAFAGIEDYTDLNATVRKQWMGFNNAPQTYGLSIHGRLNKNYSLPGFPPYSLRISKPELYDRLAVKEEKGKKKTRHGLGGYLMGDKYGPIKTYSGMLTYAYHIPLGENFTWSIGAGAGINHSDINIMELEVMNPEDVLYNSYAAEGASHTYFNMNLGTVLYGRNFFLSYASNQLLRNKMFDGVTQENKLNIHHYGTAGLVLGVTNNIDLYPHAVVKYVDNAPVSIDGLLKARFGDLIWAGAGYRHDEAVVGMLGFIINNKFNFGYSYDMTVNGLKNHNNGTHELSLSYMMFNRNNSAPRFLW